MNGGRINGHGIHIRPFAVGSMVVCVLVSIYQLLSKILHIKIKKHVGMHNKRQNNHKLHILSWCDYI